MQTSFPASNNPQHDQTRNTAFQQTADEKPCASMASPSYTPAAPVEDSYLGISGPPSSPFVSEVERSRMPSAATGPPATLVEDQTVDIFVTPAKAMRSPSKSAYEDKENIPHERHTAQKQLASPRKAQSPRKGLTDRSESVPASPNASFVDSLAPPHSARKARMTPKKTPSKAAHSVTASPRSGRYGSVLKDTHDPYASNASPLSMAPQNASNVDDTCFSTFSEAPDMTQFAKYSQSTSRQVDMLQTPRGGRAAAAATYSSRKRASPSRSPSPTPRRLKTPSHSSKRDETTTFLIDFTQQIESVATDYHRTASPAKNSLRGYLDSQRTPAKSSARQSFASTPAAKTNSSSILNLLDFELPPAPTPRSIPTITVRELESLKSSYLSQISALKATLSGREAEVDSLKRAVGDAERRAGEAAEHLREAECRREQAEEEKSEWETRGREVENLLRNVKDEVMKSEAEKEDLLQKLEQYERRIDEAEARALRAEERLASALAAARGGDPDENGGVATAAAASEEQIQRLVEAQIDARLEAVSRELHAVYKEKHERKIAKLKESYKATSERKYADFKHQLDELERQNEELQAAKDATFSGPLHGVVATAASSDAAVVEAAELKAQLEEHKVLLARVQSEMQTSLEQQQQLMLDLQQERIEKGELVAAVDEMLLLQVEQGPSTTSNVMSVVEDFRKSISRPPPSGLRAPSESKIGRTGISSLARSTSSGGLGKSKMLANIERMGRSVTGGGVAGQE